MADEEVRDDHVVDDSQLKLPQGVKLQALGVSAYELAEETIGEFRAKLFRLAPDVEGEVGWRERCIGTLKFLKHPETNISRLVMRQDKTLKVFMNHQVVPGSHALVHPGSEKTVLYNATDFAEEELKEEQFTIRFKDGEVAAEFVKLLDTVQADMKTVLAERAASGLAGTIPESATTAAVAFTGPAASSGAGAGAASAGAGGAAGGASGGSSGGASGFLFEHSALESTNKLTEEEAQARSGRVSDVAYRLHLDLTDGDDYNGKVTVTFQLGTSAAEEALFLDFTGYRITSLSVNGTAVTAAVSGVKWENHRLTLPASLLKAGAKNDVVVEYANKFDHTGAGFHTFKDPEDGQVYVYTNFEPFDCHRMLPCFDQPDLKAVLTLSATAPAAWEVITNGSVAEKTEKDGAPTAWTFNPSPRISTYIFAVVAGPYYAIHDKHGETPLGIYCRKSLEKYLDAEELFEITKQGLDFYTEFFGIEYFGDKYDQLFVPEFNEGAMENAGCVTFAEAYVYRDPPTQSQRLTRADTILHEMAHMWFGDLVTMKWWDGLWLNESFATYMAALCVAEATRFGGTSWVQYNSGMKGWAYREAQLSTAHPVNPESVPDTDATFLLFDGVSYGVGSAALKQLVAVVGMDNFKRGMQIYFQRHKWGNTTLSDLLAALQEAATDVDLKAWSEAWLQTTGVNTLRAEFSVDGTGDSAKLTSFAIHQTAPEEYPTLRPHKCIVAAIARDGSTLFEEEVLVLPQETTEVPSLAGRAVPNLGFCYVNYDDHTFAKVDLDPLSLEYVQSSLSPATVPSSLLRQLLWRDLYDMTRDAKLPAQHFLKTVRELVASETDPELVTSIIRNAGAALRAFIPDGMYQDEASKMHELARTQLSSVSPGDSQILWARLVVGTAVAKPAVERLFADMESADGIGPHNYKFDQGLRWSIVSKCVAYGCGDAETLVSAEAARDPSDRGTRSAAGARVSVPDAAVKATAWERFTSEEAASGSLHEVSAAMNGFIVRSQKELVAPYFDKFFDVIVEMFEKRSKEYAQSFYYSLMPLADDSDKLLLRVKALLSSIGEGEESMKILRRMVMESVDSLERQLKCRQLALRS